MAAASGASARQHNTNYGVQIKVFFYFEGMTSALVIGCKI